MFDNNELEEKVILFCVDLDNGEDIDVKLIAVYENSQFTPTNPIFEKPDLVFSLEYDGNWIINVRSKNFKKYFGNDKYIFSTNRDAINGMYQLLIDLNDKHETKTGRKAKVSCKA